MAQKPENTSQDPWMQYMLRGEYAAAWNICDAALAARAGKPCWHWPRHLQYIWDGSPLKGKRVLVRCYHGLGDTIQFIRYMPLVKAVAAEVIVWGQEALLPLLASVEGVDQVLALHDGSPEAAYDVDVELMELPHVFRTELATIPNRVPYLSCDAVPLPPHGPGLNLGLAWKGGDWDPNRNIPFKQLLPLFELGGANIYILQNNAAAEGWQPGQGIHPGELNVVGCAGLMRHLDLVISVDSMMAHLAGALGLPVWNLLQADADWRWMQDRPDSPWYPTMRLFRQPQAGDWQPVIANVKEQLQQLVNSGKNSSERTKTDGASKIATHNATGKV